MCEDLYAQSSQERQVCGLRYADSAMLLAEDTLPYISRTYPGADQLRRVLHPPEKTAGENAYGEYDRNGLKGFCLTVCLAS